MLKFYGKKSVAGFKNEKHFLQQNIKLQWSNGKEEDLLAADAQKIMGNIQFGLLRITMPAANISRWIKW